MNTNRTQADVEEMFPSDKGWSRKITIGRQGCIIMEFQRINEAGQVACCAESRERMQYTYDEDTERWGKEKTGEFSMPTYQPCFAAGVIQ